MAHDIRICFLGDSLVNGTGDETALGWVGRVCAHAHARGVALTAYNLGVRRDTTRDLLARGAEECARRLPADVDARVVIACGINDTTLEHGRPRVPLEESATNLQRLLERLAPYRRLVIGPTPIADARQNDRIAAVSARFAERAAGVGVPFISLFESLAADAAYVRAVASRDGAHPGSAGYAAIAAEVLASPQWWFR